MSLTMTAIDLPSPSGRPRVLELAEPAQLAVAHLADLVESANATVCSPIRTSPRSVPPDTSAPRGCTHPS